MHHTPTRQLPAREQQAAGVILPYFCHDLAAPINYHLTMVKLQLEDLDRLVLFARAHAATAEYLRNPLDNRTCLAYPATNRERVGFCRHSLLNRSVYQTNLMNGYSGSYDQLLGKIERKGVDVAARQLDFKLCVLRLIAETYPTLALECAEQAFKLNRKYDMENTQ